MYLSLLLMLLSYIFFPAQGQDIHAGYRKDFFYPYDHYPEAHLPSPVDGGRFHLVTVSNAGGTPDQITLNGKLVTFPSGHNSDNWYVDWLHVYPPVLEKGKPVWISFHTRDSKFDKIKSSSFQMRTNTGDIAVSGTFPVSLTMCNITYITTTADYHTLLVHVHNGYSSQSRTIQKVLVNNTDMTTNVTNKLSLSLPPQTSTLLILPLSTTLLPGSLITVVLQYSENDAVESVAGVRLAKTHFPIESWPKSHECPFPTVNDANYKWHRSHGIDTFFFGEGAAEPCGSSTKGTEIAGQLAPKDGFYCLIDTSISPSRLQNSSNVLGILLGDEADVHLDDGLRKLMNETQVLWQTSSSILTYCGGSRSRRNGIFAGVTDIQGMDMYIAACAPHIQEFLHTPPMRGSYDYLRLTRNNHMPLPTWTYSQLLDDGWDAKIGDIVITHRQPDPYEARIQAMSVVAGCAKGLMYFQSEIAENEYYPDTWVEIGNFNKDVMAVREYLREGDCTDMVVTSDGNDWDTESLVQTIRSPSAIFVPVINVKNDGGYNDVECEAGVNMHWKLNPHSVTQITVTVPHDFGSIVDMFEVQNGVILNISSVASISKVRLGIGYYGDGLSSETVTLNHVHMDKDLATRLFVLANSDDVRKNIENNLKH